jgi:tetratricopeptide (TPR) repeat protein
LVLGGVLYFLWTKRTGWGRHALLGLGFFLILLAPFLGFNAGSYMNYTWVMDHLLYIPIMGLIGLVVAGWEQLEGQLSIVSRRIGVGIAALLVALMAWWSWNYAALYSTLEGQWRYNVAVNPGAALPHNDLAVALSREGHNDEAIEEFRKSVAIDPLHADAHRNLGISLYVTGKIAESAAEFRELVRLMPNSADAHYQLGLALDALGREAESEEQYRQALALDPRSMNAYNNLAAVLAEEKRVPEAIEILQKAAGIDPANQQTQDNLAKLLAIPGSNATKK